MVFRCQSAGWGVAIAILVGLFALPPSADAQPEVVEVELRPTARAQIAIWVEREDETFVRTLRLTQAVAYRGIGNRPGAAQMNSGFRWPYGRREGVLPVWAHRRAAAPEAEPFGRVIFQDRTSEGHASRSAPDFSRDEYFCLSFNNATTQRDALDAVTCASVFNSDKGRYIRETDVNAGYAEPHERAPGDGDMRPLSLHSLYPPRRDAERCAAGGCYDHGDVDRFARDAREVMPDIDAVTMATPPGGAAQLYAFTIPESWEPGLYYLYVEVNTEGDYNDAWDPNRFPTPTNPTSEWDYWAINYGYPYRGQPSVVYRVPFELGAGSGTASVLEPWGYGSLDGSEGTVQPMDGLVSNDPLEAPGSGADRLLAGERSYRVRVNVIGTEECEDNEPPGRIPSITVEEYPERHDAHRYAVLRFIVPEDDQGVQRYEVRVGREPMVDEASFERALPAQAARLDSEALEVPTDGPVGSEVEVAFGGLRPETLYFVGIRAVDRCNAAGPIASVEYTTPEIQFTTVSPCFVATAAYGTPMADEIGALRRLRDRHLLPNAPGRALVSVYERVGPRLASMIREDEGARAFTRQLLRPAVAIARMLD